MNSYQERGCHPVCEQTLVNKPQHIAFVFYAPNMEQLTSGKRRGYLLSSANWRQLLCMDVGGREGGK